MNSRERQLHLGLDPERSDDPKFGHGLGRVLEQGGLPHARFAMHHQHAPAPSARAGQQPVELPAFPFPTEQLPPWRGNPVRRSGHSVEV